jgi:hypothetical protein
MGQRAQRRALLPEIGVCGGSRRPDEATSSAGMLRQAAHWGRDARHPGERRRWDARGRRCPMGRGRAINRAKSNALVFVAIRPGIKA